MPPLIIKLTELSQKILTMTKCKHQKMFFCNRRICSLSLSIYKHCAWKKQIWTTSHFAMVLSSARQSLAFELRDKQMFVTCWVWYESTLELLKLHCIMTFAFSYPSLQKSTWKFRFCSKIKMIIFVKKCHKSYM